jgi:hypothetical protein
LHGLPRRGFLIWRAPGRRGLHVWLPRPCLSDGHWPARCGEGAMGRRGLRIAFVPAIVHGLSLVAAHRADRLVVSRQQIRRRVTVA